MTAVLSATLVVIFGVAPVADALRPFADPTIFLLLGSFVLAEAMTVHGLDRRFAFGILSLSWVGSGTARILLVYGAIAAALSMWISNTATTAMMFPIGLGTVYAMADVIAQQTGKKLDPTRLRLGTGMMLMAAYAASVGGIGTPVGAPPNLIGIALIEKATGIKIPFFQRGSAARADGGSARRVSDRTCAVDAEYRLADGPWAREPRHYTATGARLEGRGERAPPTA